VPGWCKSFVWRELEDAPENIREEAEYFITVGSEMSSSNTSFSAGRRAIPASGCRTRILVTPAYPPTDDIPWLSVCTSFTTRESHVRYDRPSARAAAPEEAAQLFASEIWRAYVLGWPPAA
jgi:hypothetical protein